MAAIKEYVPRTSLPLKTALRGHCAPLVYNARLAFCITCFHAPLLSHLSA